MPKNMCPGCGNYLTEGADCPDCTMSDALVRIAELERLLGACLAAMVITQNKVIPTDWTSMIEAIDKTLRP